MKQHLLLTSNSPGEVLSWVRVTVKTLRQLKPNLDVTLCLVPCPYAAGTEKEVAAQLQGLDRILAPWETTRFYLGLGRSDVPVASPGLVVFLGGDPWHALLLGRKLGYRTVGYFSRPTFWSRFFDVAAVTRPSPRWRIDDRRVHLVGDLMVDGVTHDPDALPFRAPVGLDRSKPVLALFPGSRAWHLKAGLGTFLKILENLHQRNPDVQFLLIQSPFISDETLARVAARPFSFGLPVARASVEVDPESGVKTLVTERGLRIQRLQGLPFQVFPHFDVALTIPGTNTAELGCAAKPFLVAMHARAYIGGGGLAGILERLPLPESLKARLRLRKLNRVHFTALPNQRAGRQIAPEVLMDQDSEELEQTLLALLNDRLAQARIGSEMRQAMGEPGAARRLANLIAHEMGSDEVTK